MPDDPLAFLRDLFDAAVGAARAGARMAGSLPDPPRGRAVVVGAGKASSEMAAHVETRWDGPLSGFVVAPYGHGVPTSRIETVEAAHPTPDEAGRRAAARALAAVRGLSGDDLALCLISGGGSALLAAPAPGLSLDDKRAVTAALLRSGATIREINCVRKHLSAIKGGRLAAAAWPARVATLAVSDAPGDDLSVIASGPTAPDPTTRRDALRALERHGVEAPRAVLAWLRRAESETPKPGAPAFDRASARVVAAPRDALGAAADLARRRGVRPVVLGDAIEGEARDVAFDHAAVARRIADRGGPPAAILSGGETTVALRGETGSGGRNREFLLALVVALDGRKGIHALACDTDGVDGDGAAAGAVATPDTGRRARALGLDPAASLARHDSGGFFAALGDEVVTGPTRTNVNDFRAILIAPPDGVSGPRG